MPDNLTVMTDPKLSKSKLPECLFPKLHGGQRFARHWAAVLDA